MTANWLRTVVTSRGEEAGAVDDLLEEVGLCNVVHDGDEWDAYVVCPSAADLVVTRLALPEGLVAEISQDDLHILLRDAGDADRARVFLRETPTARGRVQMVRHLRIYVRDRPTFRAIRAGIATRMARGAAAARLV